MINKAVYAMYSAYLNAMSKLERFGDEEDGMETIETVILIAVAVIIAGVLINILTKDFNGSGKGLIAYIFSKIAEKLNALFE